MISKPLTEVNEVSTRELQRNYNAIRALNLDLLSWTTCQTIFKLHTAIARELDARKVTTQQTREVGLDDGNN